MFIADRKNVVFHFITTIHINTQFHAYTKTHAHINTNDMYVRHTVYLSNTFTTSSTWLKVLSSVTSNRFVKSFLFWTRRHPKNIYSKLYFLRLTRIRESGSPHTSKICVKLGGREIKNHKEGRIIITLACCDGGV